MTDATEGGRQAPRLERWRALDLFRLVAVVLMVQGHVFTALLDPALRQEPWYDHHRYLHGLTAPIFFFSSGLAFALATLRHWHAHTSWGQDPRRRFERYGWLLFIGYMLSLPELSFRQVLDDPTLVKARAFLKVDALENIAVSLAILQGLVWLVKRPRAFVVVAGILCVGLVLCAPWAWRFPAEDHLPLVIAAYVNADTGSIFPLFPWSAFIFAGAVAAYLSMTKTGSLRPHRALALAIVGVALWLVAKELERSGMNYFGEHNYWKTSPVFFATRLGLVMLGFAVLCGYETLVSWWRRRGVAKPRSNAPDLVQRLSQETLVIYVAHLFLLYRWPVESGLSELSGLGLSLGGALTVAALILVASAIIALLWANLRQRYPARFRSFQFIAAGLIVLVALVKP